MLIFRGGINSETGFEIHAFRAISDEGGWKCGNEGLGSTWLA